MKKRIGRIIIVLLVILGIFLVTNSITIESEAKWGKKTYDANQNVTGCIDGGKQCVYVY